MKTGAHVGVEVGGEVVSPAKITPVKSWFPAQPEAISMLKKRKFVAFTHLRQRNYASFGQKMAV